MTAYSSPGTNSTDRSYPTALLHELFEEQVHRTPEAVALGFQQQSLTYTELNSLANGLANKISCHVSEPNSLIAVCMDRSFEMVIALFAILKSGAAYVPLDPEYPDERLSFMLDDINASVVLTQTHLSEKVTALAKQELVFEYAIDEHHEHILVNPPSTATQNDLAYVIFTSGSTGRPKGAMNSHGGITNRIHWMQEAYLLTEDDTVFQKTPFSFDVSGWEFYWPLVVGAKLEIAEPEGHRDNTYLINTIIKCNITTIHFVPSMLQHFVEHPRAVECTSLKRVICSGEALPKALQDRFFDKLPDTELHNLYGPTEAAIDVTAWVCDPHSELSFVPIGKPIANTQIYILDEQMQPVVGDSVGEIYIGGVQVGLGYLNRDELSAESFIQDSFSVSANARLYKTGDLARYLKDGNVEFLGRSDFQIKIRGFRVELGEIEAAIDALQNIRQSVVISHQKTGGDTELVAYVSIVDAANTSAEAFRSQLSEKMPDYMVPALFVVLDTFPLTASGKIDRAALPLPIKRTRANLDTPYVKANTEIELFIVEQWQQLLDIDDIGTSDRFFELGGTSLQAVKFINVMQKELGESIFVVSLFSAPSASAYAKFVYAQYQTAAAKRFGPPTGQSVSGPIQSLITETDVVQFQHCVPCINDVTTDKEAENPPAIFILSPPRSGTTLLRIMLAGHPDLFSGSELQLLGFHTLQERASAYSGKFSTWLDGTIRTIMEIRKCDALEAKEVMIKAEKDGLTTQQFYRLLQSWVTPQTLVDKSPSYALDPAALMKSENDFNQPRFIHLVRDPRLMIESFEKHHMEQVLYLRDHNHQSQQLAELVWTLSHRNIISFLSNIPEDRCVRLKFEDLVSDPAASMKQLCTKMNLEYHQSVVEPYSGLENKMVNGVFKESAPMGDPNFIGHGRIKSSKADATSCSIDAATLGEPTRLLAQNLGYALNEKTSQRSSDRQTKMGALRRQANKRRAGRNRSGE